MTDEVDGGQVRPEEACFEGPVHWVRTRRFRELQATSLHRWT